LSGSRGRIEQEKTEVTEREKELWMEIVFGLLSVLRSLCYLLFKFREWIEGDRAFDNNRNPIEHGGGKTCQSYIRYFITM